MPVSGSHPPCCAGSGRAPQRAAFGQHTCCCSVTVAARPDPPAPSLLLLFAAPGSAPLLPGRWSDPYAIAALLHGAWRAYVVSSGMYYAFTIYASINKGARAHQLLRTSQNLTRRPGPDAAGGRLAQPGGGAAAGVGPVQPLRHHLSLTLPLPGSGGAQGAHHARPDGSLLHTIRERFDKATMVQVGWVLQVAGTWRDGGVWWCGARGCAAAFPDSGHQSCIQHLLPLLPYASHVCSCSAASCSS